MNSTLKVISTINSLVSVNNKRFERYTRAADQTRDINTKLLFMKYAVQAKAFNNKLNRWLIAYGTVMETPGEYNIFSKSLMGIKEVFTFSGRKYLLNDCALLEREAIKSYSVALGESLLPYAAILDIQKQRVELEEAYQTMKSLQESPAHELLVA